MSLEVNAIDAPRIHYEHIVHDTLRKLWKHKLLITTVLAVALAAQLIVLAFMVPRYTGEALIQLDFVRDENVAGERLQSTAAVDAAAVVDSAARIIRSRATASAVVSALRLDNDPDYTHPSLLTRVLSRVGPIFDHSAPMPRDLAITRLTNQITVTNDPRSYLITVAVTTSDPERAARLANWVASEYLRGRQLEQAAEAYAAAGRTMTALSAVYGPRHPTYLSGLAKLDHLKEQLDAARKGRVAEDREAVVARDMIRFAAGQTLLPAEVVRVPSGPNAILLFLVTTFLALVVGILLALLVERGSLRRPGPSRPILRE
ncbi:hypothetical protein AC630_13320 [Bradyrhizobium sp. AS23.2]|nr:hypothetical protein AC630_13320 [Bradyrhizobium sp. AS23.2]